MSNTFNMEGNTITYTVTSMRPGIKHIHDIHSSYVTSNTDFVTFMIPGVNTLVMPGVNYIYELIGYIKFTFIQIDLLSSIFI